MASNSLLEALVYADRIFKYISKNIPLRSSISITKWNDEDTLILSDSAIIQQKTVELQQLMRKFAGVVRNNKDLKEASFQLEKLYIETEDLYQRLQ